MPWWLAVKQQKRSHVAALASLFGYLHVDFDFRLNFTKTAK